MNPEQREVVAARGEVFVSAGAGTGKTTVLVERFVRAVCEQGIDVESILVITYTRKAAGELRARIRAALRERGRPDLARRLDGAWVSTIHGFCARLPAPPPPAQENLLSCGGEIGSTRRVKTCPFARYGIRRYRAVCIGANDNEMALAA